MRRHRRVGTLNLQASHEGEEAGGRISLNFGTGSALVASPGTVSPLITPKRRPLIISRMKPWNREPPEPPLEPLEPLEQQEPGGITIMVWRPVASGRPGVLAVGSITWLG